MLKNEKITKKNNSIECKIILLGKNNVGKTSLILQYSSNIFQEELASTIGAEYISKDLFFNDQKLTLNIWDTSGQERYRSLSKIYFKNSHIIILVYDITSKESFNDIINFWYNYVTENLGNNLIFAIVANKSDLYLNEQVSHEEGENYAKKINAFYFETSAKNNEGINEMFSLVGKTFLDNYNKQIIKSIKKSYTLEKDKVIKKKKMLLVY
jgi:small GTP-binding protein